MKEGGTKEGKEVGRKGGGRERKLHRERVFIYFQKQHGSNFRYSKCVCSC